jgi:hypothetical protein
MALKCISTVEGQELVQDIHTGECGHHSSAGTLTGKAYHSGFYWPSALTDAAEMVQRCEASSSMPSKFISLPKDCKPSCSLGPSLFGGWTSWVHSHKHKEVTATSTFPSTSSPTGRRWSLCEQYRPGDACKMHT